MADTFVTYKKGEGFWIHEDFIQLALCYIVQEISKNQYDISNKQELLEDLNVDIQGYTHGYMSIGLFEYINSISEEQKMIQILQNLIIIIQNKGTYISVAELQSISTEDEDFKLLYSRKPFPTSELIKILDALIKMLQGTWDSTDYDMEINYRY